MRASALIESDFSHTWGKLAAPGDRVVGWRRADREGRARGDLFFQVDPWPKPRLACGGAEGCDGLQRLQDGVAMSRDPRKSEEIWEKSGDGPFVEGRATFSFFSCVAADGGMAGSAFSRMPLQLRSSACA